MVLVLGLDGGKVKQDIKSSAHLRLALRAKLLQKVSLYLELDGRHTVSGSLAAFAENLFAFTPTFSLGTTSLTSTAVERFRSEPYGAPFSTFLSHKRLPAVDLQNMHSTSCSIQAWAKEHLYRVRGRRRSGSDGNTC